ncbi:hypothetical protein LSUB1_G008588, partial [Lachnellula subtilissima]
MPYYDLRSILRSVPPWQNPHSAHLQNLALRKILGTFHTSPIQAIEVEASLSPPAIRLDAATRKYAFRLAKLSPDHPVNRQISNASDTSDSSDSSDSSDFSSFSSPPKYSLQRIASTIAPLLSSKTEPIQHFHFAPWDRSMPWATHIAKLPKAEAATAHRLQLQTQSPNRVLYYTDGSQMPDSTGIG